MMFLWAASTFLAAHRQLPSLPVKLQPAYERAKESVIRVSDAQSQKTGLAVFVDRKGYAVTGRTMGSSTQLEGMTLSGAAVKLGRVAADSVSGVTLFEIVGPIPGKLVAAIPAAADMQSGVDSIAILPSGPIKAVVTKTDQISYIVAEKRAMPVDQVQLTSPASDMEGGFIFDDQGRLQGILQAALPVDVDIKASRTSLSVTSQFGPPDLVVAFSPTTGYLTGVISGLLSPSHHVIHPMFGVEVVAVSPNLGALVVKVQKGSPADLCGLKTGDIITRLGDWPVHTAVDYLRALLEQKVGRPTQVLVNRQGRVLTLRAFLVDSPSSNSLRTSGELPAATGQSSSH